MARRHWHAPLDPDCPTVESYMRTLNDDPMTAYSGCRDEIVSNFERRHRHCEHCLEEWRELFEGTCTPRDYCRQQIATTRDGFQVMCTRHSTNMATIVLRAVERDNPKGGAV